MACLATARQARTSNGCAGGCAARRPAPAPQPPRVQMRCSCGGRCPRCNGDEAAEREADRVATALGHRMPPPVAAATLPSTAAAEPAALQQGGVPLPATLRGFYEPRFGHDFADVRLHADAPAHAWSERLGAAAFTVGRHVWLGRGATAEPGFLMAHELAHVVQQRGAAPQVQRQPAPAAARAAGCDQDQEPKLRAAIATGDSWIRAASAALRAYAAAPADAAQQKTAGMLRLHFHRADASLAQSVADTYDAVHGVMRLGAGSLVQCVSQTFGPCPGGSDAAGDRRTGKLLFCPLFFKESLNARSNTAVHEFAHLYAGRQRLEDRAYSHSRRYAFLTPEEAFDNAESFSNLAEDLATGLQGRSLAAEPAPVDRSTGCRGDAVQRALALAEGWNLAGLDVVADPLKLVQAPVQGQLKQQFGNSSAATVAMVVRATRIVGTTLAQPMDVECHGGADAQCPAGMLVRREPPGRLKYDRWHLCPDWAGLADDAARGQVIYAAVLRSLAATRAADTQSIIAFGRAIEPLLLRTAPAIPSPATP